MVMLAAADTLMRVTNEAGMLVGVSGDDGWELGEGGSMQACSLSSNVNH